MGEKKGQITVFIIIGIIILIIIGTALYMSRIRVVKEIEIARPKVVEFPLQVRPIQDIVNTCIQRLATDGLRKIGDQGGYIDPSHLSVFPPSPTDGEAIQFSPGAGPNIAYWWHMKSNNRCKAEECQFGSERPPLFRGQRLSIETQLDEYITKNLKACVGTFEEYTTCTVQELEEPQVTTNIAEEDVFFVGKYPLRAICDGQTFDVSDFYINIDLNLKEIYNLATELTDFEKQGRILEQATKALISAFSGVDSTRLPPPRALDVGPPMPGTYWVKLKVLEDIKALLTAYIRLIQTSGVRNYNYIAAPAGTRDSELYELTYNRQFFLPLNSSHPDLEVRFAYFDWWEPYFDLNCNGQLCRADTASNFKILPFTINRYEFAYDLSYPVLVEIRNPDAFNKEGYSFKFFLEQNLRNSQEFAAKAPPFEAVSVPKAPSIFCDPKQRTSGNVTMAVRDGLNLQGMNGARISYICGNNNCNLGETVNGTFKSKFPRCLGGTLRITNPGYATYSSPLDIIREDPISISVMLEPVRAINATVKNFVITKQAKYDPWGFMETAPLRPHKNQSTTITMRRQGTEYDEDYDAIVEMLGTESKEIFLIPGKYAVTIYAFLKENLTIPVDERCTKFKKHPFAKSKKNCYFVPNEALQFNETRPYPYGGAEYEFEITSPMLRGAKEIEFRLFVQGIDRVDEQDRIVEDLSEATKVQLYVEANEERIYPVIK